jgi:hypothetical protein
MERLYKLTILILLVVISGFLLFNQCGSGKKPDNSHKIDTFYIKATNNYHEIPITIEKPVPFRVEVPGAPGATITIPTSIDSLAIIKDYFTKRIYQDSLMNDSVTIYLTEEVFKNELKRIKVGYRWKVPTMVIKETKTEVKQLLFVGVEPYGNMNRFGMFASADFDTRKALFGYGYDPFNQVHKVSVKAKINLWNKKK